MYLVIEYGGVDCSVGRLGDGYVHCSRGSCYTYSNGLVAVPSLVVDEAYRITPGNFHERVVFLEYSPVISGDVFEGYCGFVARLDGCLGIIEGACLGNSASLAYFVTRESIGTRIWADSVAPSVFRNGPGCFNVKGGRLCIDPQRFRPPRYYFLSVKMPARILGIEGFAAGYYEALGRGFIRMPGFRRVARGVREYCSLVADTVIRMLGGSLGNPALKQLARDPGFAGHLAGSVTGHLGSMGDPFCSEQASRVLDAFRDAFHATQRH